jgi:hypothetical protein
MRIALALAALLAAAGLTATSSAWMGQAATSSASATTTGTVKLSGTGEASSLLATRRLRPGLTRTATTTVVNAGTVPADLFVRLRGVDPADALLLAHLTLRLQECSDSSCRAVVGAPALTTWVPGAPTALGRLAPGASRFFMTTITWPADRDDPLAYGATAVVGLRWSARTGPEAP